MLTAHDFRYMYENGKLPDSKQIIIPNVKKEKNNKDKILEEWSRIETTLATIAQTFLNSESPENYPPCFYINMRYTENIRRVQTELFFKIERISGVFNFDVYSYRFNF